MHGWILTKLGRNHPPGLGIQRCSYITCSHHGGPGEGSKLFKFQTSSPDPVKLCSAHRPSYVKNKDCLWQFQGGGGGSRLGRGPM